MSHHAFACRRVARGASLSKWVRHSATLAAALGVWVALTRGAAAQPPAPPEPTRIIFDTDMGNDIDDAMALAMLHALQTRGQCQILAVTLTKNDPLAGPFVAALDTFYGRGTIPIGVRREGGTNHENRFLKLADARDGDHLRYPRDFDDGSAPEAKELLRTTLAAQPDGSVVLVQVGFFSNLAGLLDTPADIDLVTRKVKLLSIMAGAFQTIEHNNHVLEYNVKCDIPAARKLARDWPTPIVWSGFEIGLALKYPAASIEHDFSYVHHHLIAEAYCLYEPPPHERPTWDLTSALVAVRPAAGYFDLSPPGRVAVEGDGFTRFTPGAGGRDRFLILTPSQVARTREALVQLVTQPPAH